MMVFSFQKIETAEREGKSLTLFLMMCIFVLVPAANLMQVFDAMLCCKFARNGPGH